VVRPPLKLALGVVFWPKWGWPGTPMWSKGVARVAYVEIRQF